MAQLSHDRSRWVRPRPAPEVTTYAPEEEEPAAGGLDREQVERIWRSVVRLYGEGLHPGLALCLRRGGRVVLDRTIGHMDFAGAAPGPGRLATPGTLFCFFSGSKAVLAMLVHLLVERGQLRLEERVAAYLPEFGQHGKDRVTLHELLSHQAGIPFTPPEIVRVEMLARTDAIIEALCALRPSFPPGRSLAYHALTSGFLLAEILRRITGVGLRALLDRELRAPLGFSHLTFGVRPEEVGLVSPSFDTGMRPRFPVSYLLERSIGTSVEDMVKIANDPRFLTGVVPSGNIIATANELSRFFELLLRRGELDGVRIFAPETVDRAVSQAVQVGLDRTIMLPLRYGLGFMLGREHLSVYGPHTPRAFGHIGFSHVLAWADPERDISVALLNNGKPLLTIGHLAWLDVMATIAEVVPRRRSPRGG